MSGQLLVVLGCGAGSGGSSVAVGLSLLAARHGGNALLLEWNPGLASLQALLFPDPPRPAPPWEGYLRGQAPPPWGAARPLPADPRVWFLAGPGPDVASAVPCDLWGQRVRPFKEACPWTVADVAPSVYDPAAAGALQVADHVVLVVGAARAARERARESLPVLADLGVAPERVLVVANGWHPRQLRQQARAGLVAADVAVPWLPGGGEVTDPRLARAWISRLDPVWRQLEARVRPPSSPALPPWHTPSSPTAPSPSRPVD